MASDRDILRSLQEALGNRCFRVAAALRARLEADLDLGTDDLLRALVRYAQPAARVPISEFYVGSAGLTAEGEIFLGVNLEYTQASFAQTVHSEQFLVSWSRSCSSSPLVTLAVSAPPCGHCRQFLREFDPSGSLRVLIGDEDPVEASGLLPRAFTPLDLGVKEPFFCSPIVLDGSDSLESAARQAAGASYTPYSQMKVGIAVRARDGRIFLGSSLENAAYNPTLPPFQAALVHCHAHGVEPTEIESVVLCQGECRIDYVAQASVLSQALGVLPSAFRVVGL